MVNKYLYNFVNWFYKFLCFIAFMLQAKEISTNYFKFPIVSSMQFISPGNENIKGLNMCINDAQILVQKIGIPSQFSLLMKCKKQQYLFGRRRIKNYQLFIGSD